MKTSKLLTMLALPLAFVACTNDEFVADNGSQATGEVLSIGEDFALTVARGGNDADTRAGYHIVTDEDGAKWLRFFWEPKVNAGGSALTDIASTDKIGLGWLNVPAAQDGRIYTNYEFAHIAWPAHDKTSKFQCGEWKDAYGLVTGKAETDATVSGGEIATPEDYALTNGTGDADLHRGLFMTDNKSIMAGDYIVYFPYDSSIIKNGYVKATSKKEFPANSGTGAFTAADNDNAETYLKGLADETFYISSEPVTLEGGVAADEFKMQAVSGIIRVKLNLANGTNASNFSGVNKIALYSKDGFIKEVELDAKKIGTANGAGLYVKGTEKKVNTLVATYTSANLTTDVLNFCIPALPTTAKNVQVIIYREDGIGNESSTVVSTNQDLTVAPGRISNLAVTLTAANTPVAQFPVVDEESLNSAITNATDGATITLLDEIRLTAPLELDGSKALTLNGGNIIIPAEKNQAASEAIGLKLGGTAATAKRVTVNNNIIIEEKGCCNKFAGLLTALNNVTLGGTVSNKGQVVFGDGTNAVKGIELKGVINNETTEFLDEEVAETYATITVKEKTEATIMNAMNIGENTKLLVDAQNAGTTSGDDGTLFIAGNKSLTNEGDILVKGNITNNNGDFVNNSIVTETVGAQITGSQITDQAADAEYICEVNSVARFGDAVDNDSHGYVTKVRFKNGEKTYVLDKEYKNILGAWIDFETDVDSDKSIEFKNKVISSSVVAAHTGDMTIKNGGFVISHNALTVESLTINQEASTNQGTFISGENLNVTNDVVVKNFWRSVGNLKIQNGITVGGNMVVENTNGKSVEFAKSKKANIAGNMTVSKDGAITFLAMSITNIKGSNGFANDGKVTIVTTTAGTEFPARVYSRSYTNGGDKTKWINGSEPIIKDSWNN